MDSPKSASLAFFCAVALLFSFASGPARAELIYEFSGTCETNCATGLDEYGTIGAITGSTSFGEVEPGFDSGSCNPYCWSTGSLQALSFTFGDRTVGLSDVFIAVGGTSATADHPFDARTDDGTLVGGQGIRIDPTNPQPRGGHDVISIGVNSVSIQFFPFGQGAATMIGSGAWTKNVTLPTHDLTVSIIGSGTVTSAPAGINCGADCKNYNENTVVTLLAKPTDGWKFEGWGGECTGTGNCVVLMDTDKSVTATFTLLPLVPSGATATSVSGEAFIRIAGATSTLTEGTEIPIGAVLLTGAGTQVVLTFEDGSRIQISPFSEFSLDPPRFDDRSYLDPDRAMKVIIRVLRGAVRALAKCDKPVSFIYCWIFRTGPRTAPLNTSAGGGGVRGTDFMIEYNPVGKRTTVTVFSGVVDVFRSNGQIITVTTGEQVTVTDVTAMPWLELLLLDD